MAITNAESVRIYVANHADITAALANLTEFIQSLPAPEDGALPNLHHGHLGTLGEIKDRLTEASRMADEFSR